MSSRSIIAICKFGGKFITNGDGSLSYEGGDAYAVGIDDQTQMSVFKDDLADSFNLKADCMSLKSFMPGNRKILIAISKDKDLRNMLSFSPEDVEIFVIVPSEDAASPGMTASRLSVSTTSTAIAPVGTQITVANVAVDMPEHNGPVMSDTSSLTSDNKAAIAGDYKAAEKWKNIITGVDQRFNSNIEFRETLHKYSIAHGFNYKYKRSNTHGIIIKCKAEGCLWRISASQLPTTPIIRIRKMGPAHTCERVAVKPGYRAKKGWIANVIKEKLKTSQTYKTRDIVKDIKREYGIDLSYTQAYRAKDIAREQLHGSYTEAYSDLPFFCEKVKTTNPGSIATFMKNEDSSFHRVFICLYASMIGFQLGCRPLIFLDSAHLNTKYQEVLLIATAADAEDAMFPIAFAVVDAEVEDNWRWFLKELRSVVSESRNITFVADVQNGLKEALADIFENSHHSYCLNYLRDKFNRDLKGHVCPEARRFAIMDLNDAALAPKLDSFEQTVERIKIISPEAYNWVMQSEPEHWANYLFEGERYNHVTCDFGKQFYSWVSEAHKLPITQMIDTLRGKMMETMYVCRLGSNNWETRLTPSNEKKLCNANTEASEMSFHVLLSHDSTFIVRGRSESGDIVDINRWDCSCKQWKLCGIPCCHAIAVLRCIGKDPYEYCSRYLSTESYRLTYAEPIHPVPSRERIAVKIEGAETEFASVTPPISKRPPGRPKLKKHWEVNKQQRRCSNCNALGHNKLTCTVQSVRA